MTSNTARPIERYISPMIASQLPDVYREEGPAFVAFIKAFYEFLEHEMSPIGQSRRLLEWRDVDTTLDQFVSHFVAKYATGLDAGLVADGRQLVKNSGSLFASKGTAAGLELLFRLAFNADVSVRTPSDNILRASAGLWEVPRYLEIEANDLSPLMVGETVVGSDSKASAIVEDFLRRQVGGKIVNQLLLSNIVGNFVVGERIVCAAVFDAMSGPVVVGPTSSIRAVSSGLDYAVGDTLSGIDGTGSGARAVVVRVGPRSGAVDYNLVSGGSGYTLDATVTITQTGNTVPAITEAAGRVSRLSNTSVILVNADLLTAFDAVPLNAAAYGFAKLPAANVNTILDAALTTNAIEVGTIESIVFAPPGSGYSGAIQIAVVEPRVAPFAVFDPIDGSRMGNNAVVEGFAQIGRGAIEQLRIVDSGLGYQHNEMFNMVRTAPTVRNDAVLVQAFNETQGFGQGSWRRTDGFLSSDQFLADNHYYQEFSYEINTAVSMSRYADIVRRMWHPAGTKMFGKAVVDLQINADLQITSAAASTL